MDQDLKKIRKLVDFMKKQGVLSLKCHGIELNLSAHALIEPVSTSSPSQESSKNPDPIVSENPYTEQDILFWSSPGFDEQAQEGLN